MSEDLDTRHRHNESKFLILNTLLHTDRYLLPRQIADMTGLSRNDTRYLLWRYHKWGYIWRRKVYFVRERGYMYRYLKPHGVRVMKAMHGLEFRMKVREVTGVNISLNRKKPIPSDVLAAYRKAINQ